MRKKEIENELFKKIISLEKFGLHDLAWEKEEAVKIVQLLINENAGILGGDVYHLVDDKLEFFGDNWSCKPNENETKPEFFLRSKKNSLKYIEDYPLSSKGKAVFSITFTEQFNKPIPDSEISTTAQILEENWLMCPDCVDARESTSQDKIVICPKCDRAYYNHRYQPVEK